MKPSITYQCCVCRKPHAATVGSGIELLQICAGCQEPRVAKGLAAMRASEVKERA